MLITLEMQNSLRNDTQLKGNEFKLYFSLITYANDNRIAYPSIRRLSRESGMSKPTVVKALKELLQKGYIQVFKSKSEYGDFESNRYLLIKHISGKKTLLPSKEDVSEMVIELDHGGKDGILKVVKDFKPKDINRKKLNKGINKNISPSRFNDFPQRIYDWDELERKLLGWDE